VCQKPVGTIEKEYLRDQNPKLSMTIPIEPFPTAASLLNSNGDRRFAEPIDAHLV
jgi:hypothetical protein